MSAEQSRPDRITDAEMAQVRAFATGSVPESMQAIQVTLRKLIGANAWLWTELNEAHRRNGELSAALHGTEQACAQLRRDTNGGHQ